jgi:hypothetical protein
MRVRSEKSVACALSLETRPHGAADQIAFGKSDLLEARETSSAAITSSLLSLRS